MSEQKSIFSYREVIAEEDKWLRERRAKLNDQSFADKLDENRFGIALSGGGIRSATINLGMLKTLNKFGLLKQADYISTVSGGGYTGAYIQAILKETGDTNALFDDKHIDYMRKRGEYLFPGSGLAKIWNQITLVVAFLVSFLMSLISPAIIVTLIGGAYFYLEYNEFIQADISTYLTAHFHQILMPVFQASLVLFLIHYIFNVSRVYKLNVSYNFERIETFLVGIAIISLLIPLVRSFENFSAPDIEQLLLFITIGFVLVVLGLFTNPNATSFHRFYRKQLADAFLHFSGDSRNIKLKDLFQVQEGKSNNYTAPYPLINTCLNLQSSKDPNFQGAKASDYFLLSPFFCGAKLLGYVPTSETTGYNRMTLPAAVTISAAAVNPGMGSYSNKMLSILLTLFNLRLGFWTWNPMRLKTSWPVVWWPLYFFYELFGRIGTDKKMVNISDGGHIENLGVMELLRRKCRLILAVDAGADPNYSFEDLENLTVRARNELGIDIRFRRNQIPEEVIRVNPSHGYSERRFAIADLYQLWEKVTENGEKKIVHHPGGKKTGVMVYVKSSITAPKGRPEIDPSDTLKYGTYKYKIYHPDFPHESTADQFFDPIQWEAYFQLGQFIGSDILGCTNLNDFDVDHAFTIPLDAFYEHFDQEMQLFGAMKIPQMAPTSRGLDIPEPVMAEEEMEDTDESPVDYQM